eukprot:UN17071
MPVWILSRRISSLIKPRTSSTSFTPLTFTMVHINASILPMTQRTSHTTKPTQPWLVLMLAFSISSVLALFYVLIRFVICRKQTSPSRCRAPSPILTPED